MKIKISQHVESNRDRIQDFSTVKKNFFKDSRFVLTVETSFLKNSRNFLTVKTDFKNGCDCDSQYRARRNKLRPPRLNYRLSKNNNFH
jgi:hypothetical protein